MLRKLLFLLALGLGFLVVKAPASLVDGLLARGVAVEDTRDGQRWRLVLTTGV